ncbi:hypothetical protein Tco_1450106 [Tanacetum coccineum]
MGRNRIWTNSWFFFNKEMEEKLEQSAQAGMRQQKQDLLSEYISKKQESTSEAVVTSTIESKPAIVYNLTKPQWLEVVDKKETKKPQEAPEVEEEARMKRESNVGGLHVSFRGVQAMDDEVMHSGEGDLTDLCRHKGTRIIVADVVYCRRMNLKFKSFAFAHFQVTISSSSTKPIVPGQNCAAVKFKNCGVITYPRSIEPHQILMLYYVCGLGSKKITILQWVLMIHSTQQVFGGAAAVTTSYG